MFLPNETVPPEREKIHGGEKKIRKPESFFRTPARIGKLGTLKGNRAEGGGCVSCVCDRDGSGSEDAEA
jgi:hypothetical protein